MNPFLAGLGEHHHYYQLDDVQSIEKVDALPLRARTDAIWDS